MVLHKQYEIWGEYSCLGFDTFGPFKLFGGIAKGHPSQDEIEAAGASNIVSEIWLSRSKLT